MNAPISSLRVIGIDPGLDGGLTCIESTNIVASIPMPTVALGKKRIIDGVAVCRFIRSMNPSKITMERVHSMPKQGISSTFSFGHGFGLLEGIIVAMEIPYQLVIPQTWMKKVLAGLPKDEKSKSSVVYCQRLFPTIDWRRTDRCKVPHDGKTDSCCIAIFTLEN